MKYAISSALLSLFSVIGHTEEPRSNFERSFIGQEWPMTSYSDEANELTRSCKYIGAGSPGTQQEPSSAFSVTYLDCYGDGRWLMLFEAVTGQQGRQKVVKVLDALLLPAPKAKERYWDTGDCELNGSTDTYFITIAALGKREKVGWKTGVRAAWTPNMATGKIDSLPTRHIVCWRPTPP